MYHTMYPDPANIPNTSRLVNILKHNSPNLCFQVRLGPSFFFLDKYSYNYIKYIKNISVEKYSSSINQALLTVNCLEVQQGMHAPLVVQWCCQSKVKAKLKNLQKN